MTAAARVFNEQTFLLTGASSGIGASLCERLLSLGAKVVAVSRRSLSHPGAALRHLPCDLSDAQQVSALTAQLARDHRDLSGAILCHGAGDFGSLEEFSEARIRALLDTNLTSVILLARACLPAMKRRGSGDLVLLGSQSAIKGGKKGAVYCAGKFALRGLAQSLREECAASGVRVSMVNPGMVDTAFFTPLDFTPGESPENALTPDEVAQAIITILSARSGAVIDEINLSPLKTVIRNKVRGGGG